MPKFLRIIFLKFARRIAKNEGLTLADIRERAGTYYIVDHNESWYRIGNEKCNVK